MGGERDRGRPRRGALVRAIPLSPIRRRGNIAVGDSKRGPADPREEKGTEGGPEGANPPLSDKKEREYSCGGFETRSQPPMGGERDRGRPRRGALVRAIEAEGGSLLRSYTPKGYRGFESPLLR